MNDFNYAVELRAEMDQTRKDSFKEMVFNFVNDYRRINCELSDFNDIVPAMIYEFIHPGDIPPNDHLRLTTLTWLRRESCNSNFNFLQFQERIKEWVKVNCVGRQMTRLLADIITFAHKNEIYDYIGAEAEIEILCEHVPIDCRFCCG